MIQVESGIEQQARKTSRYNSNIRIENNVFRTFAPRLVHAYSVDGLIFRNNIIQYTKAYQDLFPGARMFNIIDCDRVEVE